MQNLRREQAKILRRKGYSIGEISKTLDAPVSTVFHWIKNEKLNKNAQIKLNKTKMEGRKLGLEILKNRKLEEFKTLIYENESIYQSLSFDREQCKVLCALLFWAEGSKSGSNVTFTNSDPEMMKVFLFLFRRGFNTEESKFRVLVHLHEYHDPYITLRFWSSMTGIPLSQFSKPYKKPSTGKSKHENYHGCVRIRYYDATISRALKLIYSGLMPYMRNNIG